MIPLWGGGSIHPARDLEGLERGGGEVGVELNEEKVKYREREGKDKETRRGKKSERKKKKALGVRNPRMMMLMKQNLPPIPSQQVARVCCYLDPTMPALLYRTLSL